MQNQGSIQIQKNQVSIQIQQNQGSDQQPFQGQNQWQMQKYANIMNISVNSSADINAYFPLRQKQQQQPPHQQVYRPEAAQDSSSCPASSQPAPQSKPSPAATHRVRMLFKTMFPDLSHIHDSPKEAASA